MKFNLFLFFLTFVLVIATASAIPTSEDGQVLAKRDVTSCNFGTFACKISCRSRNGICCPCSNIPGREICRCGGQYFDKNPK
nr:12660_t:CDS:2 [Entrophospora candida]